MKKTILRILSYLLVSALVCVATLLISGNWQLIRPENKLTELEALLEKYYADDLDRDTLYDAAADALVDALPDRWSYYISAEEYASYLENKNNAYVGVGITVQARADLNGLDVLKVTEGGGAADAGIRAGDQIIKIDGVSLEGKNTNDVTPMIKGEEGTQVEITVLREGQELTFSVTRKLIRTPVATGTLLENNIGLVRIENFNNHCADETIAAVDSLLKQGAQMLIFDVRNNGGGYTTEMVRVLDYLLPAGNVFRTVDYSGKETVETSDASCVDVPMAVLVNGNSYSAAEFFAAALEEYDAAILVGEQTTGKGFYQITYQLSDGSAVAISSGRYYTPNGKNLEGIGLTPEHYVQVDEQTAANIYNGLLAPMDDPQILAAIAALTQ